MASRSLATYGNAELAQVADENFIVHANWVQQRTAGMTVIDDGQRLLTDSGLPTDIFNIIATRKG